jgi:hypothetical protein
MSFIKDDPFGTMLYANAQKTEANRKVVEKHPQRILKGPMGFTLSRAVRQSAQTPVAA